jgi:hypothetical protein
VPLVDIARTIRADVSPYRYPLGLLFAIGEEAARGLAEWDIRMLDNDFPCERVAATCSSELLSAAKSGNEWCPCTCYGALVHRGNDTLS